MLERRLIEVDGMVQGVGFRPYVHRLAVERDLRGFVQNGVTSVLIDVEGDSSGLDAFCRALTDSPPPLSRIGGVRISSATPRAYAAF
ncbi:MAG: acylphosphatase [Gemmatimonas sp.]